MTFPDPAAQLQAIRHERQARHRRKLGFFGGAIAVLIIASIVVVPRLRGSSTTERGFDPLTTPMESSVELERVVRAAVESSRPHARCPDPSPLPEQSDMAEVVRLVDSCVVVEYIELDGRPVAELRNELQTDPDVIAVDTMVRVGPSAATLPSDPRTGEQWHLTTLDIDSFIDGWPEPAIVKVAVIDSGVDAGHRDLGGRAASGMHTTDGDPDGHGTHVAGIIAASANNGHDTAGIAPMAEILAYDVIWKPDERGIGVAAAIFKAVDDGADVINLSIANLDDDGSVDKYPDAGTEAAVRYAQLRGVMLVASAGNCGNWLYSWGSCETDQRGYPAAYPGVIAVASFDKSGDQSSFSTSALHVDVAAPGRDILSLAPDDKTAKMSGTSQAAPMVSGVLAHAVARYPGLDAETIVAALLESADRDNWSREFGHGRIDPAAFFNALSEQSAKAEGCSSAWGKALMSGAIFDFARALGEGPERAECANGWAAFTFDDFDGETVLLMRASPRWELFAEDGEICDALSDTIASIREARSVVSAVNPEPCSDLPQLGLTTPRTDTPSVSDTTELPVSELAPGWDEFCRILEAEQQRVIQRLFPGGTDFNTYNSWDDWATSFEALGVTPEALATYFAAVADAAPTEIAADLRFIADEVEADPTALLSIALGVGSLGEAAQRANLATTDSCGRSL